MRRITSAMVSAGHASWTCRPSMASATASTSSAKASSCNPAYGRKGDVPSRVSTADGLAAMPFLPYQGISNALLCSIEASSHLRRGASKGGGERRTGEGLRGWAARWAGVALRRRPPRRPGTAAPWTCAGCRGRGAGAPRGSWAARAPTTAGCCAGGRPAPSAASSRGRPESAAPEQRPLQWIHGEAGVSSRAVLDWTARVTSARPSQAVALAATRLLPPLSP